MECIFFMFYIFSPNSVSFSYQKICEIQHTNYVWRYFWVSVKNWGGGGAGEGINTEPINLLHLKPIQFSLNQKNIRIFTQPLCQQRWCDFKISIKSNAPLPPTTNPCRVLNLFNILNVSFIVISYRTIFGPSPKIM